MEESDSTTQPHRSSTQTFFLNNDVKDRNAEIDNRKVPKRKFSRLVSLMIVHVYFMFITCLLLNSCICSILNLANNSVLICVLVLIKKEKIMPNNLS